MKTLYIMRHPEKSLTYFKEENFDLKLSEQGIAQAHLMGEKLKSLSICPDLLVASPAKRTRQTAEIMCEYLCYEKNIMYNEVLYNAFLNELIETISYTFDTVNELFIIGHNPSLALLAHTFVNFKEEFKPCTVLKIEFNCNSWIDIDKENANLLWVEQVFLTNN
ncbi:MAG: histidine phosphatase family protein [Arcobacteraceae bacterium]